MALLFFDGFDHYSGGPGEIAEKWSTYGGTPQIGAWGRNSTSGLRNSSNYQGVYKIIADTQTIIVGFAYYPNVVGNDRAILQFWDSAVCHLGLQITSTNKLALYLGDTGSAIATSTNSLNQGGWNYIEAKFKIGDAGVGSYEVRVNGSSTGWIPSTTGDTRNGGNATANKIGFICNAGLNAWFDDIYICDTTGSYNNDFLGDCRAAVLMPNGDGTYSNWTASAGNDYECVDETTPNDDTDYISSLTGAQVSNFVFPDLTGTMGIKAVQTVMSARKDNAGSRSIRDTCRSDGVDRTPGDTKILSDSYLFYMQIRETDPATSSPWTVSGVNAAEFGVELVS